ncbi:glycosyltransferase [Anditalea andensis]|nr:glycosyltransferase [Anditalea andensis]
MDPIKGGPCQGIRNAIPELKKIGVSNEVLCLDDPKSYFLKNDKFTIHAFKPVWSPWSYNPYLIPWLMQHLYLYDVVIIHGLWQFHSYAVHKAIIQLKKTGADNIPKIYIMPHGMLDPYSLKSNGKVIKALRKWVYWNIIEAFSVNDADGVLFTCQEELMLARITYKSYHPKIEINVGYGIEEPPSEHYALTDAFFTKCPGLKGEPYLLFLSRIHEKKGVDILIKAYQQLALNRKLPKLVLAGPGINTHYGHKIRELIKSNPRTASDIYIPGMLVDEEKWGAFYGCEAFILPSHQENFGIAVVEALACGKPVLISDQVNIWREIKHFGGGIVAPDSLTGVISLLNTWTGLGEAEKSKMKKKARMSYLKRFSISKYAVNLKQTLFV